MARRYRIALLELNTFAHVLCALLVYAFWWSKPLDVCEPIIINGSKFQELLAYMSMASEHSGRREIDICKYRPNREKSDTHVRFNMESSQTADLSDCQSYQSGRPPSVSDDDLEDEHAFRKLAIPEVRAVFPLRPSDPADAESLLIRETTMLSNDYAVFCMQAFLFGFHFEHQKQLAQPDGALGLHQHWPYILLTRSDIRRWRLASRAVRAHVVPQANGETYLNLNMDADSPLLDLNQQGNLLVDRVRNWPADIISFTQFRSKDIATWVAIFSAGFGYGSIHLLAWYAPFSTDAEEILWKLSGLILLASGPSFAMASRDIYAKHSHERRRKRDDRERPPRSDHDEPIVWYLIEMVSVPEPQLQRQNDCGDVAERLVSRHPQRGIIISLRPDFPDRRMFHQSLPAGRRCIPGPNLVAEFPSCGLSFGLVSKKC
jgi:hypothetical protein